jgi:hypothetical protein
MLLVLLFLLSIKIFCAYFSSFLSQFSDKKSITSRQIFSGLVQITNQIKKDYSYQKLRSFGLLDSG